MGEFNEEPTQSPGKDGASFGENFELARGFGSTHLSSAAERFAVFQAAQSFSSRLWKRFGLSETPQTASEQAILKIRPQAHWSLVNFREMWEYRDLLWTLAVRDLKLRYRQTSLGILWVVFQPVAGAGVFALVFGWVAGMAAGKQSYFVFSLAGLLVWTAFQSTLLKCSMALLGNGALVSKVTFQDSYCLFPRFSLLWWTLQSDWLSLWLRVCSPVGVLVGSACSPCPSGSLQRC